MNYFVKRKIAAFALMVAMVMGVWTSGGVSVYAATATATANANTKVEALKTYKGNTKEFNAYDYYMNNADLQTAIGPDGDALLKHYNEYGKKEGRVAIASNATTAATDAAKIEALKTYKGNTSEFNAYDYYVNNADLQTAIGPDGAALSKHYKNNGKKEGRIAIASKAATTAAATTAAATTTTKSSGTGNNFNTYNIPSQQNTEASYVLNTNSKKFHYPSCKDVKKIKPENYSTSSASRDEIIAQGYSSCGHCHP